MVMKAKLCNLCGGEPEFVYYAIPQKDDPYGWDFDDYEVRPMILFKQIRCKKCGAVSPNYSLVCDDAISAWNEQKLLQLIGTEPCEVEKPEKEGCDGDKG